MKNLLILLLLLTGLAAHSQIYVPIHNAEARDWQRIVKALAIPYGPTPILNTTNTDPGFLFFNTTDSSLYAYIGGTWVKQRGAGGSGGATVASYGKNSTNDSTVLVLSNGTRYAASDRSGGSGTGSGKVYSSYGLSNTNDSTLRLSDSLYTALHKYIDTAHIKAGDSTTIMFGQGGVDKFGVKFTAPSDTSKIDGVRRLAGSVNIEVHTGSGWKYAATDSVTDTSSISNRVNTKEPTILAPNTTKKYFNGYKSFVSLLTDSIPQGTINLYSQWLPSVKGIYYGKDSGSLVGNVGIKVLPDTSKLLIQNEEGRSGIVIRGVGSDEARTIPWYLNSTSHAVPLIAYGAMSNNVQAGIAASIVAIDMIGTQGANQSFLNAIRTAALQFNVAHTYDPSTGYVQVLDQAMVMIPDKFSPRVVITKFSSGDTSAMFQVGTLGDSTKGALLAPPLNTRQVNNLAAPMNGLIVRNIDSTGNNYFINTGTRTSPVWVRFGSGTSSSGGGTVTNFSKTDLFGITSSVTNPTTTPNHSIGVDTTNITSKAYTTAGLALKLNITDTVNKATRFAAGTNTSLSLSGNVLTINSTASGTTGTEVYNELYTGSAGTSITTTNNPTVFKHLYKNGVLIYSPSDYTISGSTITLVVARLTTDKYSSDYKY